LTPEQANQGLQD